jgi:single-stranded-DNA-specific exonuclease
MPEWEWRLADSLLDGVAPDLDPWPLPLRQILYNRGYRTREEVEAFLNPEKGCRHDPFLILGMERAVERIYRALREEELIAIYGDFDVDGLTAVALLCQVLESPSLQGRVTWYLPHRTREGYGLNNEAIKTLAERGTRLLITVDCGIGADEQIRYANSLGLDVIVTDHHLVSDGVPPALAVLNSRQDGCSYPFKELSGVAMAYKLAEGLLSKLWGLEEARERLRPQLDLVALGVIADVAPLVDENRLLVKLGLQEIARGRRLGLRALLRAAGWSQDRVVDTDCVSYVLAPRLNAAGRIGDARLSLELLLCRSETEVSGMAAKLDEANRARQQMTATAVSLARQELLALPVLPPVVVVAGDYPAGIVGLVAGKLAEEFNRPAFVVEYGEQDCRGSGRSIPGFDIVRALSGISDLLIRFGGHAQAGGFAFPTTHLAAVKAGLEASAAEQLGATVLRPDLRLEATLRLNAIGPSLYRNLALLEPFGAGNSRPFFCSRSLLVRDSRTVGNGHLKMWLSDETGACPAIGFGMANGSRPFVRQGSLVDCAYTIARDERAGSVGYELVLKDIRPSDAAPNVL